MILDNRVLESSRGQEMIGWNRKRGDKMEEVMRGSEIMA